MTSPGVVTLTLLHPKNSAPLEKWRFEKEFIIRIGRSPENNVVLSDSRVSRHHLELRMVEISASKIGNSLISTAWRLINLGTNGTFLDGILVSQAWLRNGSLIQLAQGGPKLKFQFQTTTAQPLIVTPPKGDRGWGVGGREEKNFPHPTPHTPTPNSVSCSHAGNSPNNIFCIHCGQPLRVERKIRQYQVLQILGQGGMGTTYLAWVPQIPGKKAAGFSRELQPNGGGLLVLKEMNADMAEIAKAQELFEREARTLKNLNHPGIPQFYEFFVEAGKKYLAMELIHGQDLEKRVYNNGPVLPSQAIDWMIQTCKVLDYIHEQDPPLIHRDIKPANLMVRSRSVDSAQSRDNQIVVLDFGAVKEIGTPLGTRIGAEGFSAPEQDRGQPVTQSDIYAVGATLIFLLTGESPRKYYQQQGRIYYFSLENVPTITPRLRQVIEKATQPQLRDRYQTAQELAIALSGCI
ncbi:protein kinase [Aerosakkonemataceae cyanobacterium BLCC-F50]|uniref:Protein kinase n=1 Tax=Floridaenema flaviceps BLCC-F50 TaxID=3153642 RepID=A0ABV4XZE3_9CYAN